MGPTIVLTVTAFALMLVGNPLFADADQQHVPTDAHRVNRTSKELQEKSRPTKDPATTFKTTGRKSSSDEYNTFSSISSDVIVETSSHPENSKPYPSLTTGSPTFVTRGRYIRNPFFFSKDDQEVEFEDEHHADFLLNGGLPKWNRYNTNHRQLNKYGPTPIEADITVDEDGSTGYGSTYDFGGGGLGGGTGYDSGSYRNPGGGGGGWSGGDGMTGWYSDPVPQASRPVPIIAEIRQPSANHKMSIDVTKIGLLALVKIAMAKLKALGFIKAMLLVLFKIKLIAFAVIIKFLMLIKFMKAAMFLPALFSFLTLPMLISRLSRLNSLLNQPVLVPNTFGQTGNGGTTGGTTGGTGTGGTGDTDDGTKRRSGLDLFQGVFDPGMSDFRKIIRSEKCVERISCRMAGAKQPSLTLIGLNWAASPIAKYIPSKKIRTFISTFTEVTNYRLDNLYNSLLPSDWTKWCNDHYACDEAKHKNL